jgi:hypothetical protein
MCFFHKFVGGVTLSNSSSVIGMYYVDSSLGWGRVTLASSATTLQINLGFNSTPLTQGWVPRGSFKFFQGQYRNSHSTLV